MKKGQEERIKNRNPEDPKVQIEALAAHRKHLMVILRARLV